MRSRGKQISPLVTRPAILNRSSPRLFNRQRFTAGFHMNGNAVYRAPSPTNWPFGTAQLIFANEGQP
jgi:hypothetical protein